MPCRTHPKYSHYETVIIGAGMSGLAAGIRLAHYNKKVCILERHTTPGGLNSFYRLAGRNFDVGLHAMTNYVSRDTRGAPLTKLLRQLRIRYEEFALCPQRMSSVRFPGVALRFTNDFEFFRSEVAAQFPKQRDNFARLVAAVDGFNELDLYATPIPTRKLLGEYLTDPLLIDMLLCPIMFYGSPTENDMDFWSFVVLFKSILKEGFARPRIGVRKLIATLMRRYKSCHGELCVGCGVRRLNVASDRVASIELDDGVTITADTVLSSAGLRETLQMCSDAPREEGNAPREPRLSFVESISVLDRLPESYGHVETITFFNNTERFEYRTPDSDVDPRSGVICCPNNFQFDKPLDDGIVRVTSLANYERWKNFNDEEYRERKTKWYPVCAEEAVRNVPDFRKHVTFVDMFTPRTVERFTWHTRGAVYGSPHKVKDGRTRLGNLFICGSDQGYLGIVGALLSGITIANLHVLKRSLAAQE